MSRYPALTSPFLALLLGCSSAAAATYTVCNAGAPTCSFSNVQDAINAANFGDTILLQAGQTFPGFQLMYKPGPAGTPIVITTTAQAELPVAGTRITPVYSLGTSPVTARIQGSLGSTITTQNGAEGCPGSTTPCPAHDYTLIGLEITPGLNNGAAYDHVQIGPVDSAEGITTVAGLPYNITLDRVYVHQARLGQVRRCVTPHGVNITIENSWICDCKMLGFDSQAIEDWNGAGPLTVTNNYLDAATEIMSLGGAMPTVPNLIPSNITVSYNHFYRPDYYNYTTWAGTSWYGQGQILGPTVANGYQYMAQNSGTTGPTEPAWPTAAGATVTDGSIVWMASPSDTTERWLVKNLFESKSSDTINLTQNVFERNPAAAQDGAAIVLTVRTAQSGSWAHIFNTTFTNNVVRNSALGMQFLGRDDSDPNVTTTWSPNNSYGTLKYATINNNLMYNIGTQQWGYQGGFIALSWAIQYATFNHNTFDHVDSDVIGPGGDPGYQIAFTNNLMQPGGYGIFGDNGTTGCAAINYFFCNNPASPTYPDPNAQCPLGAMDANVIPNQSVSYTSPCTSSGLLPSGNFSTPWNNIGFVNSAAGDYTLQPTSQYIAAGTDGLPLGANTAQLPLIANLTVTPTSNSATFTYTAPNSIACVLRVSTDREFNTVVPAVDPTRFLHADSDQFQPNNTGLNRTFTVGSNTTQVGMDGGSYDLALTPSTTYWYWLACGGEGQFNTFTTLPASGIGTSINVVVTPASAILAQGQTQQFIASAPVTWSATAGTISSSGLYTAPASIAAQQTVTIIATTQGSPAQTATATVTLVPPVTVTPASSTLAQGQTQQFTASAPVTWSATAGTISSSGLYTAPAPIAAQQTVTIIATTQGSPAQTATATVTLVPPVNVTPASSTLAQGQAQQFTASAPVTWSATAGTISSSGLYTAPASIAAQQTVTVTATTQGSPTQTATATITLVPPVTVSVTPGTSTLSTAQTQQFTATVSNTTNTAVTWSISPPAGTISATGLYTAPQNLPSQQTVTVTATSQANATRSASATVTLTPPLPAASFLASDTTTQGNWNNAYGSDGYNVIQNSTKYPSYVTVTPSGNSAYTWSSSTSAIQALQKATASDRIAAAWYSKTSFGIDLNFTDGGIHRVAVYCLDWDQRGRTETVQVVNSSNNTLLDTRSISNFAGGLYLAWNLSGHVKILITRTSGPSAVLSGIFFGSSGAKLSYTATSASFLKLDTTTQGSWMGVYGSAGYNVINAAVQYPLFVTPQTNGTSSWTWASSTSDPRALQIPATPASGIAATWYNSATMGINLGFADGAPHQVAAYFLDWDQRGRAERIDVLNAATGTVLDTRTISGFAAGQYLTWTVTGNVTLRITCTAGPNAVISGLFFQ